MLTVTTFGDSILDCARYNSQRVDPAGLLVANRDDLFPEFRGRDLTTRLGNVRLVRAARDGSTVDELPSQASGLTISEPAIAVVTVGGNDLIHGLLHDDGPGLASFGRKLTAFLDSLAIERIYLGTVYDPTFGDNTKARGLLSGNLPKLRDAFDRMNALLAAIAPQYGALIDIHAHFLTGAPDWFVNTIEPSLRGASEVRRCILSLLDHGTLGASQPLP